MTDNLKLLPINEKDYEFLYKLLSERKQITFISHKKMPTYEEHVKFVKSEPYSKWYIIQIDDKKIGSIYLTKQNEIGIHILEEYEDDERYKNVIKEFIKKYPQDNFFLNISPRNELYINFVKDLGFHLIQHTYERDER